ncbi:hypothetical protein JQ599_32065 [Bradyrhizobium diazoefficiens]|nr:hypothetical protein [Bradyrhizobium diazoefficiens]MBR0704578.1 hypothetical protein [Bradyrhizobium diazoefficiens]MBR0773146.1 hypothetical protein [Bradyrhizobium diazoefficiens]
MTAPTPEQIQLIRDYEPALNFVGKRGDANAERFYPSDAKRYLEKCALSRAKAPYATRADWGAPVIAANTLGAVAGEADTFLGAQDASGAPLYLTTPAGEEFFLEMSGWKSIDHYADLDRLAARYRNEAELRASQFWYHAEFFDASRIRRLFKEDITSGVDFNPLFAPQPNKPAVITDPALICYYLFYPGHDESLGGCIDSDTGLLFEKAREYGSFAGEWSCIALLLDRASVGVAYAPKYVGLTNRNIGLIKVGDREVRTGMRIVDWSSVPIYEGTHPRFSVAKGTHGLYLLNETIPPVEPLTSDDIFGAFCGNATPIATYPPDFGPDPNTGFLPFAKMAAGSGIGMKIGGLVGAGIGAVAGIVSGIAEIASSHTSDGGVALPPPIVEPKQDDVSANDFVVHPKGKRPAGVDGSPSSAQEWNSDSVTLEVGGHSRQYDFIVDRETQVLWGEDPDALGYTGRWGPFVLEDPDTRRAGMKFPKFWQMFFDAIVRSDPPAKVIVLDESTSWTVPADWNNSNNSIELIGGGGGGAAGDGSGNSGAGGGGGAYAKNSNVALTPGAAVAVVIGAGGPGGTTSGAAGASGGDTSFNNGAIVAKGGGGGVAGATPAGGAGGSAEASTGVIKFSGGAGGAADATALSGGGGGGGAGGPKGAGGNGGAARSNGVAPGGGGGGGGNGGGETGFTTSSNDGGDGGSNLSAGGSGAGGTSGKNGLPGVSGGGGGGGYSPQGGDGNGTNGGNGSDGMEFGVGGSGSGGGGGGRGTGTGNGGAGAMGGWHGGGGGGGGRRGGGGMTSGQGGDGRTGGIKLTWVPK